MRGGSTETSVEMRGRGGRWGDAGEELIGGRKEGERKEGEEDCSSESEPDS